MNRQRFLVVDDHYVLRQSLVSFLRAAFPKAEVREAHNGREALDLLAVEPLDIVLLDARMPHLDGIEATREIKARWPQVRVVALALDVCQRDQALAAGADAWVFKGCLAEDLLRAVLALEWKQTGRQAFS